ncbi:hypothetical protein [Bordetella sp. FB-8]|uniref:hypothetical protein n=1 Tax=Bordetella sp. FB-8 TaxID=1159870 RepID=UPI00037405DA|nr:hypothetical protein [Bordetella sp. FB-8]
MTAQNFQSQARTINLTPTWGEWGNVYRRFAESGERKAIVALREDFARAMASTQALQNILHTLSDAQQVKVEHTMAEELAKQGF